MGNSKRAKSARSPHKKSIPKNKGLSYLEKIFQGPIKGEALKSITLYYLASKNNRTSASVAILLSKMSGAECTKKQVIDNQVLRYIRDTVDKAKSSNASKAEHSDESEAESSGESEVEYSGAAVALEAEYSNASVPLQNKIFEEMQTFVKKNPSRGLQYAGEYFIKNRKRLLKEPLGDTTYSALSPALLKGIFYSARKKIYPDSDQVLTAGKAKCR